MTAWAGLATAATLLLAGCGSDDDGKADDTSSPTDTASESTTAASTAPSATTTPAPAGTRFKKQIPHNVRTSRRSAWIFAPSLLVSFVFDGTPLPMVAGIAVAAALAFVLTQATIGRRAAISAAE